MTTEYLVQMNPVIVNATWLAKLILLVSFFKSIRLFADSAHLEVGAQKKTVKGPTGELATFCTKDGIVD